MQIIALRSLFANALSAIYDKPEIDSIFARILGFVLNYSKIEIHQNLYKSIDPQPEKKILEYLSRLSGNEPIQYILGFTEFYNQILLVDKRVLIPRSETEFLVDIIVKEQAKRSHLKALDLCTGSGCIAIALAKSLPNSIITATDISSEALDLARLNAQKNKINIQFVQDDLFKPKCVYPCYDFIVSNPPYIGHSERKLMQSNVLNYEPPLALFVSDAEPLIFYKAIANFGLSHLSEKGTIYVEINEAYGKETEELFSSTGYKNIKVLKDINQKDRYLIARL
jgi:release factor glutamine methyltransferase